MFASFLEHKGHGIETFLSIASSTDHIASLKSSNSRQHTCTYSTLHVQQLGWGLSKTKLNSKKFCGCPALDQPAGKNPAALSFFFSLFPFFVLLGKKNYKTGPPLATQNHHIKRPKKQKFSHTKRGLSHPETK